MDSITSRSPTASVEGFTLVSQTSSDGVQKQRLKLTIDDRAVSIAARELLPNESKGLFFFITLLFWKKIKVNFKEGEREILVNRSSIKKHLAEDSRTLAMQKKSIIEAISLDGLGIVDGKDLTTGERVFERRQKQILALIGGDWGLTLRAQNKTHKIADDLYLEVENGRFYVKNNRKRGYKSEESDEKRLNKFELKWFFSSVKA